MEFATDAEAATYRMLTQVLQTHLTTQTMSVYTALGACERLLAMSCQRLEDSRGRRAGPRVVLPLEGCNRNWTRTAGLPRDPAVHSRHATTSQTLC